MWAMIVLSGGLLTLSFPPIGLYGLVWISLVPFFILLHRETSYRKGFLAGFFMGLMNVLSTMYWISVSVYCYGGIPLWGAAALTLLFVLYLSLYWGLTGFIFVFMERRKCLYLFPFAAVLVEYIRGLPLTRFPWGGVEMAIPPHLAIAQIVDVTGIYGLGFLIILVNFVIYRVWFDIRERRIASAVKQGGLAIIVFSFVWAYGFFRIPEILRGIPSWTKMKVCLVQPDIDQLVKWRKSWKVKGLKRYIIMSETAAKGYYPDLIVWPEAAVTFYINEEPDLFQRVQQLVRDCHFMLIFGAPSNERVSDKTSFHNSAYLLSKKGGIVDRYDKVRLVPFGEYVPMRRWIPFAKNIVGTEEDFTPGRALKPLKSGKGPIGVTICFEGIFPEISRTLVRRGALLLINLTNDAWFGRTSGPYQHLRLSAYRSVEERIYLIRSTGTGVSAIIDPTGRILARIPLQTEGFIRATVRLRRGPLTFYARYGDIFVSFCAIFTLIVLAGVIFVKRGEK